MSEYTAREILDMIEDNQGARGLDLSGKDLSGIDLSRDALQAEVARLQKDDPEAQPPWISRPASTRLARVIVWLSDGESGSLEEAGLGGINLEGAVLRGANLKGADLRRANLEEADLAGANLEGANLWGANLERAYLSGAKLGQANLARANLEWTYVSRADLTGADLSAANLASVRFEKAVLERVRLTDANLSRGDLRDAASIQGLYLHRALLDYTRLTRDQLGDAIGEEMGREWRAAREAYLILKNNFEQIGRYDDASWAYRKERRMEKQQAWEEGKQALRHREWGLLASKTWKVGCDLLVEYLCDYGESVGRVLRWMGFLLFVVGPLVFGVPGLLDWPEENYEAFFGRPAPQRYWYAYVQQFLYVLDAFTTAGFARLEPATSVTSVLSGSMALTGVFLTGLLGFVAGNRIRRS